jgi:hypothetical protein
MKSDVRDVNQMLLERVLGEWLMWWTEGNGSGLKINWKWSEVKWSEVKWSEVKGGKSGRTVKGIYGRWSEAKWSEGHVKIGVHYLWNNNISNQVQYFLPLVLLCCWLQLVSCVLSYYFVCIFVTSCVLLYCVCIAVLYTVVAGLLARCPYPEGPATGHLGTGFSLFPCV